MYHIHDHLYTFDRNFKASSPWLNVILIAGVIIRLPSPLYGSLLLSANQYDSLKGNNLTPLCHVSSMTFFPTVEDMPADFVSHVSDMYNTVHDIAYSLPVVHGGSKVHTKF